jgi:hypothetical protein
MFSRVDMNDMFGLFVIELKGNLDYKIHWEKYFRVIR